MKPHVKWPLMIGALLAIPVVANGYLLFRANADPSFAIEPDYYNKAVAWDAHRAAQARSDELGWRVTLDRSQWLTLHVADRGGQPVDGAQVTVEAFHNARAGQVLKARMAAAVDHTYVAPLSLDRPGIWELRVEVVRGADRFDAVLREDVP